MMVLYAAITLGGAGLLCGVMLAVASKYLAVETDSRVEQITEVLPKANCGGCGFAGCSAFAEAVVSGKAEVNGCSAGGAETAKKIAEIMGVSAGDAKPKVATVLCRGTSNASVERYEYEGISDCAAAARLGGGQKACAFSCLGFGNCVKVCRFDAINVVNGVAEVDIEKCTGCGACVRECPKKVIELIPKGSKFYVGCSSHDRGIDVKNKCTAGCIACRICEKNCPSGAITIENNLAKIDYEKCTGCGICKQKCPKNIIIER